MWPIFCVHITVLMIEHPLNVVAGLILTRKKKCPHKCNSMIHANAQDLKMLSQCSMFPSVNQYFTKVLLKYMEIIGCSYSQNA